MRKIFLRDLLSAFGDCSLLPASAGDALNTEVWELTYDSRTAERGQLFFCLPGASFDGHDYAPDAYAHGARLFAAEHPLPLPEDAVQIIVPDTRRALADCAALFFGHPEREMTLIGITGTKGKTTTAMMTAAVLNACGRPCGYIGTNGITYGSAHMLTANSTPESLVLYRTLRQMLDAGVRLCVMEVSSQGLWKGRVRGMTFAVTLFTNLSPDHVGGAEHPDYDHYRACKHTLFTDYGTRLMLCQAFDPDSDYMVRDVTAPVLYFGTGQAPASCADNPLAWQAVDAAPAVRDGRPGTVFSLLRFGHPLGGERFLPMPGQFNLDNALGALAVCCDGLGVPVEDALAVLADVSVPGRFQVVTHGALPEVSFIIDYAHNGVSLAAILDALRVYKPRRLICLFGSVGGRTFSRRRDMAEAAAHRADLCILTSDNPGQENPDDIIRDIDRHFPADGCPRLLIPDREAAIREAVRLARPGDIILLAGKGHEDYQLVGTRRVPFREEEILRNALNSLGGYLSPDGAYPR